MARGKIGWNRNDDIFFVRVSEFPDSGPSYFKITVVSLETSNRPGKQEIEKRQYTSVLVPGLILNLRMLGGLLVMNLIGWSVDCLCRSVAEINCSSCSSSKIPEITE